MTHFVTVVLFDEIPEDIKESVAEKMAPYDENNEMFRDGSRWDWYVIGGRWEGVMMGVDPEVVEETCSYCDGTGSRARESLPAEYQDNDDKWQEWLAWSGGCNVCRGTGKVETYPNQYEDNLEKNSGYLQDIASDFLPASYVLPTGEWVEQGRQGWWGMFIKDERGNDPIEESDWEGNWKELCEKYPKWFAVSLDCHV